MAELCNRQIIAGDRCLSNFGPHRVPRAGEKPLNSSSLYKSLGPERLAIIGISSDQNHDALDGFLKEYGIPWPQVNENFDGVLHRLFRIEGEPTYFLVGPDGNIVDKWVGAGDSVNRIRSHMQ